MTESNTTSGQDRESRRQFWQQHVGNWQKSGLNLAAYCRQHGLKHYHLRYWKSRKRQLKAVHGGRAVIAEKGRKGRGVLYIALARNIWKPSEAWHRASFWRLIAKTA